MPEVRLDQGTIQYDDVGSGPPMVFVHGFFVDAQLWRDVVPDLSRDFRCIVPTWPFGAHRIPMEPDCDLSAPGIARLIADFLAALDLEDVILVANDTGGGYSQIVATEHPDRIGKLVLTPCDAYNYFPTPLFRYLKVLCWLPGSLWGTQLLRWRFFERQPWFFGWLTKRPADQKLIHSWIAPFRSSHRIRRDNAKFLRGIKKRHTLRAAEKLKDFDRPTLIAWAREDKLFPLRHGERLAATIPNARLEIIEDAYTYVSLDQPGRVIELVRAFAREPSPLPSGAATA